MIIFYPLSKPISMVLDWALGEEIGTIHTRQELSKLLQIHVTEGAIDKESGAVLQGALKALNTMTVCEIMTPIDDCYMLHISCILDFKLVGEIFETGFSRIPVFDKSKNDVVALLFAKDLILVDPDDETPLRYFISIFGRPVEIFNEKNLIRTAFFRLREGHSHLALVQQSTDDATGGETVVLGVVTLEDIVEEILQGEIIDESDRSQGDHRDGRKRHGRSKFRLLNAHVTDKFLSQAEAKALASHLLVNGREIRDATDPPLSVDCLQWILMQSRVILEEDENRKIYEKGVKADFAVVVLTGRIEIQIGENEFRRDAGSLSIIAPEALFSDTYVPDFTAIIGTEKARIVVIEKKVFQAGRRVFCMQGQRPDGKRPTGVGNAADPTVRHAFANQIFSRRFSKRRGSDGGQANPADWFASEPLAASEPGDTMEGTETKSQGDSPNSRSVFVLPTLAERSHEDLDTVEPVSAPRGGSNRRNLQPTYSTGRMPRLH